MRWRINQTETWWVEKVKKKIVKNIIWLKNIVQLFLWWHPSLHTLSWDWNVFWSIEEYLLSKTIFKFRGTSIIKLRFHSFIEIIHGPLSSELYNNCHKLIYLIVKNLCCMMIFFELLKLRIIVSLWNIFWIIYEIPANPNIISIFCPYIEF
jgi:hypothetical protein